MSALPLVQELVPPPDPEACCERLAGWPHRLWLDSASDAERLGRFSFLTADPCALVEVEDGRVWRTTFTSSAREAVTADGLDVLRELLGPFLTVPVPGLPPFQGGLAGYIGYEFGGTIERLPPPPPGGIGMPDLVFGLYDWTLAWDHSLRRAWLISTGIPEHGDARRKRAEERMMQLQQRLRGVPAMLGGAEGESAGSPHLRTGFPGNEALQRDAGTGSSPRQAEPAGLNSSNWPATVRSSLAREDYLAVIRRVREYILAGDIYQANITQRFTVPLVEAPWSLYRRLRAHNPAPFSAFLDFGDVAIASVSPERFVRLTSEGIAEARPIKGTRPRGETPADDALLAAELLASEKDRAEHVMIVDLLRNDLSRVCAPGTVRVPELFALERYTTVHHLVSTIVGTVRAGCDAVDVLRATFPGGSVTGAPKIRAMEIISELEPVRRDAYCGSIGYLSVSGALDASIVIRSVLIKSGHAYCSAGGGIVAESDPEAEYAESWNKARGLLQVLGAAPHVSGTGS